MKRNKQRTIDKETLSGKLVHGVALSKSGIPQLGYKLGFITVGKTSGSVKDRSIKKDDSSI